MIPTEGANCLLDRALYEIASADGTRTVTCMLHENFLVTQPHDTVECWHSAPMAAAPLSVGPVSHCTVSIRTCLVC